MFGIVQIYIIVYITIYSIVTCILKPRSTFPLYYTYIYTPYTQ